jgi:hypothetical protein
MDLKLPVMKGLGPKDRHLKMSDYLKFVMFNLKYTIDIAAARKAKKEMFIGKPFRFY